MTRKKAKGRAVAAAPTHHGVYESLLLKSLHDAQYNRDQMKNHAQWPLSAVFHMVERIKLVAPEKKHSAERITLIEYRLSILGTTMVVD